MPRASSLPVKSYCKKTRNPLDADPVDPKEHFFISLSVSTILLPSNLSLPYEDAGLVPEALAFLLMNADLVRRGCTADDDRTSPLDGSWQSHREQDQS